MKGFTPLKSNIDTQNSHVWKEIHLKTPSFWVSMLDFGRVTKDYFQQSCRLLPRNWAMKLQMFEDNKANGHGQPPLGYQFTKEVLKGQHGMFLKDRVNDSADTFVRQWWKMASKILNQWPDGLTFPPMVTVWFIFPKKNQWHVLYKQWSFSEPANPTKMH